LLLVLTGCGTSAPSRVVAETPDSSAPSKAMELYDANHDGVLDAKELEKVPGLKAYVDRTKSGKISADQIAARIKEWADSKAGRVSVAVRITHNGKPLPGAKVAAVPEKFLGGTIPAGEGVTSSQGMTSLASPYAKDPSVRGMAPGFYRVEITKEGEKIPAKYNTETTLGIEAALDASDNGFETFDLKY
jgi:hypothetical protein